MSKAIFARVTTNGRQKIVTIPKDAEIELGDYVRIEVAE